MTRRARYTDKEEQNTGTDNGTHLEEEKLTHETKKSLRKEKKKGNVRRERRAMCSFVLFCFPFPKYDFNLCSIMT